MKKRILLLFLTLSMFSLFQVFGMRLIGKRIWDASRAEIDKLKQNYEKLNELAKKYSDRVIGKLLSGKSALEPSELRNIKFNLEENVFPDFPDYPELLRAVERAVQLIKLMKKKIKNMSKDQINELSKYYDESNRRAKSDEGFEEMVKYFSAKKMLEVTNIEDHLRNFFKVRESGLSNYPELLKVIKKVITLKTLKREDTQLRIDKLMEEFASRGRREFQIVLTHSDADDEPSVKINNIVVQVRVPQQGYSNLGRITKQGDICGPMSIRSCYFFNQIFQPKVGPSRRKDLMLKLVDRRNAVKIFKSLNEMNEEARNSIIIQRRKNLGGISKEELPDEMLIEDLPDEIFIKTKKIHSGEFSKILNTKGIKGLPNLKDLKLDENLCIIESVSDTEMQNRYRVKGILRHVWEGFSCGFIFLEKGPADYLFEGVPENEISKKISHWICIFVVRGRNTPDPEGPEKHIENFYWFVADSLNNNQLEGDRFEKIKYFIYKLFGADTSDLDYHRKFRYYDQRGGQRSLGSEYY